MKRISRIERVGNGLKVTMADGTSATYANAAQVPDEIARLIARMDSEPDVDGQAQGGAEASRAAYLRRLEQAHQQGQAPYPGQGLQGVDAYKARLQSQWAAPPPAKGRVGDHKRWQGD
jgi:hypothetical protein